MNYSQNNRHVEFFATMMRDALDFARSARTNILSRRAPTHRLLLMVVAIALSLSSAANAQLVGYNFTGQTQLATSTATTTNAGLDSSFTLSRGSGAPASTGSNSFRTTGFSNDGISISNTDYFTFALSASPGNTLSVSSIKAIYQGTATYLSNNGNAGALTQFAYSIDGAAFTLRNR